METGSASATTNESYRRQRPKFCEIIELLPSPALDTAYTELASAQERLVRKVRDRRNEYRAILADHLKLKRQKPVWDSPLSLSDIREVLLLLSGSRGGSSVTASLLRHQARGAEIRQIKLLSLPGEQTPHLMLAGLMYPLLQRFSDELFPEDYLAPDPVACDTTRHKVNYLRDELLGEIGYPLVATSDLRCFAITVYGRLLLQWPALQFDGAEKTIRHIEAAVMQVTAALKSPGVYWDYKPYRTMLMLHLRERYPEIDLHYYDGLDHKSVDKLIPKSIGGPLPYQIEEPPFIMPQPWHYADTGDVETGTLLLKDPADAWRIGFWQAVFPRSFFHLFHLTRDPRAAINGLCDGWRYPYGYHTMRAPKNLRIRGYSEQGSWQSKVANYSSCEVLWKVLNLNCEFTLEDIAALQWSYAHEAILRARHEPGYWRIGMPGIHDKGFEWIERSAADAMMTICQQTGIKANSELLGAARSMKSNRVQVIPGIIPSFNRWEKAENANFIHSAASHEFVKYIADQLEYYY